MKKIACLSLFAYMLVNVSSLNAAPPTSGAYVNDPVNSYVQDQALEPIENVSMVMCFMGSLRAEQKIGAGNYNALVDKSKCENKGESGGSSSAGASSVVEYTSAVVNATRADTSSPMRVKAWIDWREKEGQDPLTIFTSSSVTKGASDTAPNGNLTMDFAGYLVGSTTRKMRGQLVVTDSTITFAETGQFEGTFTSKLTLTQSGVTSGSGRVSQSLTGTPRDALETYDSVFAYNSTHFTRKKGSGVQQCFARSKDLADVSVWRYGVYKSDGSRLELANPGFPLTYTTGGQTYWGYAGFYGIYFPDTALNALAAAGPSATVTSQDGATNYTYSKVGGKLTKLTRSEATLNEIKGLKIGWVWLNDCNNDGCTGSTYNIEWNGTNLIKTEKQKNDGNWESANDAVISTTAQIASYQTALYGWSEALGGQVIIDVPSSGFSGSTKVTYSTRANVSASDASSLTLICVNECLKNTNDMSAALPSDPFIPIDTPAGTPQTRNWSAVAGAAKVLYKFSGGMMYVHSIGGTTQSGSQNVDASNSSTFTTSGTNAKLSGNYQWGLRTGLLVAAQDGNGLAPASIRCDINGNQVDGGSYICPNLFQNLTEAYEWETGPNSWNQNATLTRSGASSAVVFDPPKRLTITLSTANSTAATGKVGSKLQLDYQGFGDLHGIPGECYNPLDNAKGPCDSTTYTNWAPEFSLKAGAEVTEKVGGAITTYYVKPIDQEMRFAKVADSNCSSLTLPIAATLPDIPTGADAKDLIGEPPAVTSAPAVIHGVVQ